MKKSFCSNDCKKLRLSLEQDINVYGHEYLKILRGETLETDGHILITRNSTIGTFHLPRSDEDAQDNSNVKLKF
jgi:hypothetical protein